MPEGDTIFRAARSLHLALADHVVTSFETVLPRLARVHEDAPLTGRIVNSVDCRGKWLLIHFSGDLILLTHMLMSGSWHIYRPGEPWQRHRQHMRIVIGTQHILAVAFNVPVAEFHNENSLLARRGFNTLGPAVLADDFDETQALANLQSDPDLEIAPALLNQSVLAGLGNVFKSEVCFVCGINPFRSVHSLAVSELERLVQEARRLMLANVAGESQDRTVTYTGFRRTTGRANPSDRLWVYRRAGEPCRRCGASIQSQKQGPDARTTFWCPLCQP